MIIRKIDNTYIIRIINNNIDINELYNQEKVSKLFKEIILKIKEKYNIKGLLDINVYTNNNYGMIIEIEVIYKDLDEIDMHIHFHLDTIFLTEINDLDILSKKEVYYYNNKFYTIYNTLSDSPIIYKTEDILEKGIKVV